MREKVRDKGRLEHILKACNDLLTSKSRAATKDDMSIFESISGAWDDGTSAEEETRKIRAARVSGLTREVAG